MENDVQIRIATPIFANPIPTYRHSQCWEGQGSFPSVWFCFCFKKLLLLMPLFSFYFKKLLYRRSYKQQWFQFCSWSSLPWRWVRPSVAPVHQCTPGAMLRDHFLRFANCQFLPSQKFFFFSQMPPKTRSWPLAMNWMTETSLSCWKDRWVNTVSLNISLNQIYKIYNFEYVWGKNVGFEL